MRKIKIFIFLAASFMVAGCPYSPTYIGSEETFEINGIRVRPLPTTPIRLKPGQDTSLGIGFKERVDVFKQQAALHLVNSNINTVLTYKRIRKKLGFFFE